MKLTFLIIILLIIVQVNGQDSSDGFHTDLSLLDKSRINNEAILTLQDNSADNQDKKDLFNILTSPVKYGYFHLAFGGYFWIFNCRDYQDFISPLDYYPVDILKYIGLTAGYRNIVQFEYRMINDDGNNQFLELPPTLADPINREETAMFWENKEWIFKVNPFFKLIKPKKALYFSYGFGKKLSHYGGEPFMIWDGRSNLFGIEFLLQARGGSLGVSAEYRIINFERASLINFGYSDINYSGGIFSLGVKVGLGYGY